MPQYSGVWSLQQQMQALTSGQWATDPLFDYTTLLLQGDAGANGAQNNTFYDTSPNQFAITRNGNTTQGSFSPFSATGWGNYFDGSGDYISMPSATSALALGSGDWTIECFVNVDNLSGERTILDILDGNSANRIIWRIKTSGLLAFQGSNGTDRSVTTTTVPTSTWVHLAICKASGTTRMFINGVQANSNYTDSNTYANSGASTIGIIASDSSSAPFLGYISNFRVVKGTALYTANFTPSPTALTAVTNTSLLTCQSNRFIDNSTNALSLTIGGNTSVQAFSPFAPQYQWTSDVIGGSGYFDGTGDYLTWTGTAAGSGAFSYEFWIYSTNGFATSRSPLGVIATSGYNSALEVRMSGTTINASQYNVANNNFTVPSLQANCWNHVVICRNASNQMTVFLNGTRSSTGALTISTNFSGLTSAIGRLDPSNGGDVTGYIAGIRLITGSTPYDPTQSTITVPTSPPTTATGTQLLCNFTNAGILDGTMKNNLETVGNAQVSTSVVKYGSGSMYFDGTGDYLVGKSTDLVSFGTGDFTIEMWVNPASVPASDRVLMDTRAAGTDSGYTPYINGGTLKIYSSSADRITSTSTIAANVWSHIAFVRMSGVMAVYINGIQSGTATYTGSMTCPGRITIGAGYDNAANYNGYIDDLRITKGIARYTQNFIPPSVALPRQ